jgi:hypothetical protein
MLETNSDLNHLLGVISERKRASWASDLICPANPTGVQALPNMAHVDGSVPKTEKPSSKGKGKEWMNSRPPGGAPRAAMDARMPVAQCRVRGFARQPCISVS